MSTHKIIPFYVSSTPLSILYISSHHHHDHQHLYQEDGSKTVIIPDERGGDGLITCSDDVSGGEVAIPDEG